ncbi:UV-stimulated scaffold protein A homolog [Salvia miltiorrhiza]|uniref:UV-stimulated scaffold protein A homolog n=1 Tax=Salvia miltiorrhiza TaxID=226208 RepID=UPI0025ACA62D|nr:UV-stimulated scaffold protein A homolog [Salvia miltiorrhiza]
MPPGKKTNDKLTRNPHRDAVMAEEREKAAAMALIERAVESTAAEVDPRLLKAIKSVVRNSDSELRSASQTLMSLMKRNHSQVRYLALLIVDELFMRSKLFRSLLVENLDLFLSLSIGFRRNHPLPPPASVASLLRSKSIEFLEKWNDSFGIHYRQLRLGYDYLKNTLRFQFPNLQANAARIQQERREREMRTRDILLKKFESLKANFSSIKEEIQINIDEIDECLGILRMKDDDMQFDPVDNEEMEEFRNSELHQIRLDSLREAKKVREDSENEVVIDALREFYKVLVTKHLTAVQEWISVLIRVEVADLSFRDSALKNLIDIRNLIQSTKRKCEESGCELRKIVNAEEEEIWEEGIVETFDKGKVGPSCSKTAEAPSTSTAHSTRDAKRATKLSNVTEKRNARSSESNKDPVRSELLAEAPVLEWGSFLDRWGPNEDVLANQRGLDVEGHWGRVDQDAVIPAEKIAELNMRAFVYEEKPLEIQPCRAPLKNGALCQRKDLRVCPFHGPIILRDDEGKPIKESSTTEEAVDQNQPEESSPNADSNVVHQLLKQAVKNVRERDREDAKTREVDKRALKRAKLAQVREHNEAMLRDAAIASTSRSYYVGDDTEISNGSRTSSRSKKQTLASMLKKKETSKDRLAQRLLNTNARGATIHQLTTAEEANYREAFPNQW